ncbi:MAG: DUF4382 domain-containing protein [Candidatus Bathyarchaeia archaeon]
MNLAARGVSPITMASILLVVVVFAVVVVYMFPTLKRLIFPPKTGTLIVEVTDAPIHSLAHLNISIDDVEVQKEAGGWIKLEICNSSFDLLKLQNVTSSLAIGELEPGNYSKIRMHIVEANATLDDGTVILLNVPPEHIDIQVHFEVKRGETTKLIIDIDVDKIQIAENAASGKPANLNPQFKTTVISP